MKGFVGGKKKPTGEPVGFNSWIPDPCMRRDEGGNYFTIIFRVTWLSLAFTV